MLRCPRQSEGTSANPTSLIALEVRDSIGGVPAYTSLLLKVIGAVGEGGCP